MPYKIYTYEDPYKLDRTDFWGEIEQLPHFCVSRTLVNGLRDVLGDRIKGLLCPVDDFVTHEMVYQSWTGNIGLRIKQFSELTAVFQNLRDTDVIDEKYHKALQQNQNHFLDAMRLFIELGIPGSALDECKGNKEQRLFVSLLRRASKSERFCFPELNVQNDATQYIHTVLVDLARKEVKDCRGPAENLRRCERARDLTERQMVDKIVVHGVHQFSPSQLRLLMTLDKMGFTIIFLFNYQKEYSKIYSSWMDIYDCFGVDIHHDTAVKEYRMDTMQNPSNALACALGTMCEGNMQSQHTSFRHWYRLYKDIEFLEFANITEYAHFVSSHFMAAEDKYDQSRGIRDRGNDVRNKKAVLRNMDELVYTANRDVHTLLKIYHPDYAKDRHFLAYPIGQFFSAIYRLWDHEKGEIRFDIPVIKECLNSGILRAAPAERLLQSFYNTEILYERITTYSEFEQMIGTVFLHHYDSVGARVADHLAVMRNLSVYNKYKVSRDDLIKLIEAVKELNQIAKDLFAQDVSNQDRIRFGDHFQQLEKFLKQRELTLANEQERALIMALEQRLDQIKASKDDFAGTFRDLKQGIHYYLKQKEEEREGADWIVKNFEQIDGDVLQSKNQFEEGCHKVYHFACLSDRDMNQTINQQLPWPLTDEFISAAYAPVDLQFQVYYTTLGMRSNFLRYALFYGLCFNRCDVRLSYVKQYDNEITESYALLSILGFEPKGKVIEEPKKELPDPLNIRQMITKGVRYDRYEMMDMFLCPYRFFLDYVLNDRPALHGDYLYQKFYENLLIEAAWKRISNMPLNLADRALNGYVDEESNRMKKYFPFWTDTVILDLKKRAKNYIIHDVLERSSGGKVKPFDERHMAIRKQFGRAWFAVNVAETQGQKHPYSGFESLTSERYPDKIFSLHKVPQSENQAKVDELRTQMRDYLNRNDLDEHGAITSEWCNFCVHRGICMKPFADGKK